MKSFLYLTLIATLVVGCTVNKNNAQKPMINPNAQPQGGVDVGNMTNGLVPHTNALMTYSSSWTGKTGESTLSIQNSSGSKIEAQKSEITDLASPNPISLQQYLKGKFPERKYKTIDINGLKGVRADLVNTLDEKQSDIYLVSEVSDFIHIQIFLRKDNDGINKGEEILSTVRIKYNGEPITNSQIKTVTLSAYSSQTQDERNNAAYSFRNECYSYHYQSLCYGVSVLFSMYNNKPELSVGNAGYDHGRIVDLGSEKEIPFESIKIDGEYLVAPQTKISIADIYTAFTPKNQQVEVDRLGLEVGHVYLIRSVSWPEEDLITKVKIESIDPNRSVTLTYQKLVYVKPEVLQKQVDEINKYTIENEMPRSEGEVTLYNRSIWKNYHFASFNFQYSTSGNMFITYNGWDILFETSCTGGFPSLHVPHTGGALGGVVEFPGRTLESLKKSDFPDPNLYVRDCGTTLKKGSVYGVYHYSYDDKNGVTYGAVEVLDIATDLSWVHLKFRRIHIGQSEHFQKWIPLNVPEQILKVKLEKTSNPNSSVFLPFIGKVGTEGYHYYERIYFTAAENFGNYQIVEQLACDSRPYGKDRGFKILSDKTSLDQVSLSEIENLKGQFEDGIQDFKQGQIIAAYLENYYDKTVFVMQINETVPGKSLTFSVKYLERAKTPYSDDKD